MPTSLPALPLARHQIPGRGVAVAAAIAMAVTALGAIFAAAPAAAQGVAARGHLLIARDADGSGNSSDLWLRESGTLEERNLTNGTAGTRFRDAVWSPDGTKIAYVKQVVNGAGEFVGDVFVMNANGSGVVQVTSHLVGDDRDPAWSPDGRKLVFDSDRSGKYQIYVHTLADASTEWLTPYDGMASGSESLDPTWSRDGSQIAFEHRTDVPDGAAENPAQIYRVTLGSDGYPNGLAALTTGLGTDNIDPAYSPDSDVLAFSRDPNTSDTAADYNIYTRSSDAAVTTAPVLVSAPGATLAAASPQWVPRLSTGAPQRLVYARTLAAPDTELRQVDITAGTDTALLNSTGGHDLEAAFQPMPGCDAVWDGEVAGTLGNWADPVNWDTDLVPGTTSRVCIPDLKTDEKVILATTAQIASLSTKENFEIAPSGNLTIGRITTVSNKSVSINGGTLIKAAGGSGVLAGGVFSWTNNNWSALSSWEVAPDATLEFDNSIYSLPTGATLVNKGLIKLNDASLSGSGQLVNATTGTIRKLGSRPANLEVVVDNDGLLSVDGGVLVLLRNDPNDATSLAADNGTFNAVAGAELQWASSTHRLGSSARLTGPGKFHLANEGAKLDVGTNGLAIPGHFYVNSGTLAGSGPLSGGVFHWEAATYAWAPLGSWEVAPDATLEFNGTIYNIPAGTTLVNKGLIKLNNAGFYNGGQVVNAATGEIRKTGTGVNDFANPLNNLGTIRVNGGALQLPVNATSGTASLYGADSKSLTGGSYVVANGAKLRLPITELANNHAALALHGTGAPVTTSDVSLMSGLTTNTGRLELREGAQVTTQALNSSGTIDLRDDTSQLTTPALTLNAGGVIRGAGTLAGNVVNEAGTVAPGSPRGTLAVTGSFSQLSAGVLAIDIDATGADKLAVTDSATVAGTVGFTVAGDAQLTWSDQFPVIAANALTIDPARVYNLPASAAGIAYDVVSNLTAGELIFDVRDAVAPDAPAGGSVSSSSGHVDSTWSNNETITLNNLAPGQDNPGGSGFKGHIVEWIAADGTVAATGLTATLPTGKYTVRVTAEDNDGNVSDPTTLTGEYWIDDTAPTIPALTAPAAGYSLLASGKTPQIKATWKVASDEHSGAVAYQLLHRSVAPNSVTWSARTPVAVTGTTKTISVKPGYTYCLAVTATDAAGNAITSAERCVGVPMDNVDLTAAGKWTRPSSTSYYRGSIAKATAAGATLTKTSVRTRRIALLATTCPTCGSVDVYLGTKKIASVSLVSKTTKHRALLPVKTFTTLQKAGNVVVKVTSKGRPVMIDAIATSAK